LALVCVVGCSPAPARDAVQDSTATDSLVGRFAGLLPCADCAGIRTDLRVFVERGSGRPTRYEASETYVATRDGDRTFEREGKWTIMRGSADNPDAVIYQLDFDQPEALRNFLNVGEVELRLLDRDQRDIPSLTPHSLHRVPDDLLANAVILGEGDAGRNVDVPHGQTFVIQLESNRSTGYRWSLIPTPSGVLAVVGDVMYTAPRPGAKAGSPGTESFAYRATQAGRQELRFEYRRPWETTAPPAKSLTFTITVP